MDSTNIPSPTYSPRIIKKRATFDLSNSFTKALPAFAKEQSKALGHKVSQADVLEQSALAANPRLKELNDYYKQQEANNPDVS